ncbi:type II toxin-antitoxin system RelE family toxin [Pelagibacterium halotolerans]|nr:type II toxin-antitoxin system RelE/ParE family toxin [Pelagibacterium halotolerans]QJR18241.1 type II toxin-antitoxin system RelE/ParE family toxin [Pelagibacterium halotolerans]SDZ80660.1 mRNA interferase RelE/StbE [Pelagibacterium halotolerans]
MAWTVKYGSGVEKQLRKLGQEPQRRIRRHMESVVARLDDPRQAGSALMGQLSGYWRYRIGDYRVLCRIIDGELLVLVVEVGHRREVYR